MFTTLHLRHVVIPKFFHYYLTPWNLLCFDCLHYLPAHLQLLVNSSISFLWLCLDLRPLLDEMMTAEWFTIYSLLSNPNWPLIFSHKSFSLLFCGYFQASLWRFLHVSKISPVFDIISICLVQQMTLLIYSLVRLKLLDIIFTKSFSKQIQHLLTHMSFNFEAFLYLHRSFFLSQTFFLSALANTLSLYSSLFNNTIIL